MPIYEYVCDQCGHHLEALQKISEEPLIYCPECGDAALRKKVSAAAFRLKGTGWYETDFKDGGKEKKKESGKGSSDRSEGQKSGSEGQKSGNETGASSGESKSDSKTETSSGSKTESSKSESKPAADSGGSGSAGGSSKPSGGASQDSD